MEKHRWIVLLAAGGLVLAGCAAAAAPITAATEGSPASTASTASCNPEELFGEPERYRAWVLFRVEDPQGAAAKVRMSLADGGDDYVIVRADVVDGDFNLVVPVDAAHDRAFEQAVGVLMTAVGAEPQSILRVVEHSPSPPHCSHTFITGGEYEGFPLEEYYPPGRHPQSPGANPWG